MSDDDQYSSNSSVISFINDSEGNHGDSNVYLDKNIVFGSSSPFSCCEIKFDSKLDILKHWLIKKECKNHSSDELFVIFQLARKLLIDYECHDGGGGGESSSSASSPQRPLFDQSLPDFELLNTEIFNLVNQCNKIQSLWKSLNE